MSYGKRTMGVCGHVQEFVFNQFAICTERSCDGKPTCPKCCSKRVTPFQSEQVPPGSLHCWTCGKVWFGG